ncbi:MAG: hypothetical protein BGO98_26015 [Myxococcales bacterium 68-20]|nr:nuclear transport factor 2 family protein [Myxococcales bacterium]OJY30200.1 MAG: hypothetical protein BGO98_26015 [Myxococcales bacterium 68-20]
MNISRLVALGCLGAVLILAPGVHADGKTIGAKATADDGKAVQRGHQIIGQFRDLFNASDLDKLGELYTEDALLVDGPRKPPRGRQNVKRYLGGVVLSSGRVNRWHDVVYELPNAAVVEWVHCYPRQTAAGTETFTLRGADLFTFNSTGLVKRHDIYADDALYKKKLTATAEACPGDTSARVILGTDATDRDAAALLAGVWPHAPSAAHPKTAGAEKFEDFALLDTPGSKKPDSRFYAAMFGSVVMGASAVRWSAGDTVIVQYTMQFPVDVPAQPSLGVPSIKRGAEIHALDIVITENGSRRRRSYWNRAEAEKGP